MIIIFLAGIKNHVKNNGFVLQVIKNTHFYNEKWVKMNGIVSPATKNERNWHSMVLERTQMDVLVVRMAAGTIFDVFPS